MRSVFAVALSLVTVNVQSLKISHQQSTDVASQFELAAIDQEMAPTNVHLIELSEQGKGKTGSGGGSGGKKKDPSDCRTTGCDEGNYCGECQIWNPDTEQVSSSWSCWPDGVVC